MAMATCCATNGSRRREYQLVDLARDAGTEEITLSNWCGRFRGCGLRPYEVRLQAHESVTKEEGNGSQFR